LSFHLFDEKKNKTIYIFSQQTYKAPEFLIKPANRTVHEGEQFQIFAKVIGKPFISMIDFDFFLFNI